jgi:HAD superfamily hydrolase (TIGR01490 family)
MYNGHLAPSMTGKVAAYFDLDGTLLDASSEKTLTGYLALKRPWRIPLGGVMWTFGLLGNLLRGRSLYDAARNRGHFCLASWQILEKYSQHLVSNVLLEKVPKEALDCIAWHKQQGHRLILVSATIAPMAEAMGSALGMDMVYGCGPEVRNGILSGSEMGWNVPRRKGKVPVVQRDAKENGHDLSNCYGYGNTMADTWFMAITGNPIAINANKKMSIMVKQKGWDSKTWKI